jgi:hypothetical protein
MFLAQSGVPFDDAMKLPLWKLRAYCVAVREMRGERYDWDYNTWETPHA